MGLKHPVWQWLWDRKDTRIIFLVTWWKRLNFSSIYRMDLLDFLYHSNSERTHWPPHQFLSQLVSTIIIPWDACGRQAHSKVFLAFLLHHWCKSTNLINFWNAWSVLHFPYLAIGSLCLPKVISTLKCTI